MEISLKRSTLLLYIKDVKKVNYMQHPRLYQIYDAIHAKDIERARELVQLQLIEKPNAEVYYLAWLVSDKQDENVDFLKLALEFDPFHVKASEAYYRSGHRLPPSAPVIEKIKREDFIKIPKVGGKSGELATFNQRLSAWIIDQLILFSISFVFVIIALPYLGISIEQSASIEENFALQQRVQLIGLVIQTTYYVVFLATQNGQTPGKKIMKIRVVKINREPINVLDALIRNGLGYIVSSLVFFMGFLWVLFDEQRQGWHDKMAATIVVQD